MASTTLVLGLDYVDNWVMSLHDEQGYITTLGVPGDTSDDLDVGSNRSVDTPDSLLAYPTLMALDGSARCR